MQTMVPLAKYDCKNGECIDLQRGGSGDFPEPPLFIAHSYVPTLAPRKHYPPINRVSPNKFTLTFHSTTEFLYSLGDNPTLFLNSWLKYLES